MSNKIEIYRSSDGKTEIHVQLNGDTLWLTQNQIVELFQSSKANISEHIKHIFHSEELDDSSTVRKFRTVQMEGRREVERERIHYNLDVIISVGYRVNSKRGTQFRQWASQRLKDYLVEGVAINNKRLEQRDKQIQLLQDGIRIISRAIEEKASISEDFSWLQQFSLGLQLLDDYDHESLDTKGIHIKETLYPEKVEYMRLVHQMRDDFNSTVFGREKDQGFDSAIKQIQQGIDNKDVYSSIEEKAAMLLYLVVKNHAFVDGNKRIAAACFLLFLERNGILFRENGQLIVSNDALASLTLFVAASKADEMESVKKLLISVLNRTIQS